MSSLNEVVNGLKKYVDAEILPKVTGWNKWVFGAGWQISILPLTMKTVRGWWIITSRKCGIK